MKYLSLNQVMRYNTQSPLVVICLFACFVSEFWTPISNVIPRSNDLSGAGNRYLLGLYRKKLNTSSLCLTTMGMHWGWIIIMPRELHPVRYTLGNFEIHNSTQIDEKIAREIYFSFHCFVYSKHFTIYNNFGS